MSDEILSLYKTGNYSIAELAEKLKVSKSSIQRLTNRLLSKEDKKLIAISVNKSRYAKVSKKLKTGRDKTKIYLSKMKCTDERLRETVYGVEHVICPYCKFKMKFITGLHLRTHGKTTEELKLEYPGYITVSDQWKTLGSERFGKPSLRHKVTLNNKIITLRSSFEFKVFDILKQLNLYFEYETIKVPYLFNGNYSLYFTDFYIPEYNLILEVKPEYLTLDLKCLAKMTATKELGYNFEFLTPKNFNIQYITSMLSNYAKVAEWPKAPTS